MSTFFFLFTTTNIWRNWNEKKSRNVQSNERNRTHTNFVSTAVVWVLFFSYFLLFFISRAKSLGPHLQIYIMITSNIKEVHICTIATTVILTVIEQQSFSFGYGPMTTSSLSMMMITVIECIINWRQISSFQFCARKKGHIVKNLKKKILITYRKHNLWETVETKLFGINLQSK